MNNTIKTLVGGIIGGILVSVIVFSVLYLLGITEIESLGLFIIILYAFSPLFIIGGTMAGVFFIKNTTETLGYGAVGGILATILVSIALIYQHSHYNFTTDPPTNTLGILVDSFLVYPQLIIIVGTIAGIIYAQKYEK